MVVDPGEPEPGIELTQNKYLNPQILRGWENWTNEDIVRIVGDLNANYNAVMRELAAKKMEPVVSQVEGSKQESTVDKEGAIDSTDLEKYENIQKEKVYNVIILGEQSETLENLSLDELFFQYMENEKKWKKNALVYLKSTDSRYGIPISEVIADWVIESYKKGAPDYSSNINYLKTLTINALYDSINDSETNLLSRITEKMANEEIEFTEEIL